jgi:hypothetical protein
VLSVLFIVLASAALFAALAALFASLRATFGSGADRAALGSSGPDLGALEDEKNALLRALKDLEYEHEVGKIDDEDYARLERAYRARAKEVLGELDRDLRPYLSRAEELAGGAVEKKKAKKKAKKKSDEAEKPSEKPASEEPAAKASEPESESETESETESERESENEREPAAPPVCPKCATTNDVDARFCKKCATPLATKETP